MEESGDSRPRVGAFLLDGELGHGASGRVHAARHARSGARVAVKVLTGDRADDAEFRETFQREARIVASLDHPAVVGLYDFGFVGVGAGPLPEGSPLLVMEAAGGTLADLVGALSWPDLHALVERLLQGLAHAHAHGIVHRDLKPRNVLVGCGAALRDPRGLRLADFGISVGHGRADVIAGTPHYMAPELVLRGALGPWTDLYALGVLAWELVTGEVPFDHPDPIAVLRQHVVEPLPPLRPRLPAPEGLGSWLEELLAKDPVARPSSAGAALASWRALRVVGADAAVWTWSPTRQRAHTNTTVMLEPLVPPTTPAPSGPSPSSAPTLPEDWRVDAGERPLPLAEVGLGLLSLRAPPLVGREAERERAWSALRAASGPSALWFMGPPRVGTSRLAAWLAVRAGETGAVEVLTGPPREAVARWSSGDPALLVRRLGAEAWLAPVLARWLADESATPWPVLAALLDAAALRAPVLWIVDGDAQAADAEAILRGVAPETRLLVVGHGEPGRPEPRGAQVVEVGPLAAEKLDELLHDVLVLAAPTARVLGDAAAGYPGVAVDLVRALAARGELEPGPGGYTLNGAPVLPAEATEAWAARLSVLPERLAVALERLAAAAPDAGKRDDWGWLGLDDDAVARLAREGLVRLDRRGLSLGHPILRDALLARADEAGRRVAHEEAWAARAVGDDGRVGRHLLRAGRAAEALPLLARAADEAVDKGHSMHAERLAELARTAAAAAGVVDPTHADLRRLASVALRTALFWGRVEEAIALHEEAVRTLTLDQPDDYVRLWSALGNVYRRANRFHDALAALDRAAEAERQVALQPRSRLHHRVNRAIVLEGLGRRAEAERLRDEIIALAREIDATGPLAESLGARMGDAAHRGDRAAAEVAAAELVPLLPRVSVMIRGMLSCKLGVVALLHGDAEGAARWLEAAVALGREHGSPVVLHQSLYQLSALLEARGERGAALAAMRESIRWMARLGPVNPVRRVTLAQFLIRRGELDAARAELDAVADQLRTCEDPAGVGPSAWAAERAWLAAHEESADAIAERMAALRDVVAEAGLRANDIADAWERIAVTCVARGLGDLAAEARAHAAAARVEP